jgi:hypothetical protein
MWRLLNWAVALCWVCDTSGQQWQWVQRLDGDASAATAIFCDRNTNIYVAGTFTGTNLIGTNRFVSVGGNDVFLAKLNADGAVLWAIALGGPEDDSLATPHLPVTTNGAVYLCGRFSIPGALVGHANASISNVFLARVDDAADMVSD